MKKMLLLIMPLLALLPPSISIANPSYALKQIGYSEGLSNSAVISLCQDKQGFMWFGTYDGLNYYDGKTMEVYRTDDTSPIQLLNNVIYGVSNADHDCMWISTSMGINRFSIKKRCVTDSFESFKNSDYQLFSNANGDTWVINRLGIHHYNQALGLFEEMSKQKQYQFKTECSFVDNKGHLWLFSSTDNAVYCYQAKSHKTGQVDYSLMRMNIHSRRIQFTFNQNGMLHFVDERNDLFLFDIERNIKLYIRNVGDLLNKYGTLKGIISFQDDIILAFVQNGLLKLQASNLYKEIIIDNSIRIFCIEKDRKQDIIWLGTDGKGVMSYSQKNLLGHHILYSQFGNKVSRQVRAIYTTESGDLWFGTKGDGIIRIKNYQNVIPQNLAAEEGQVYSLGKKYALRDYNRGTTEYQVFNITPSKHFKGFWIGSAEDPGLSYYDKTKDEIIALKGKGTEKLKKIHGIFEQNDSVLWAVSADSGLCKVQIDNRKIGKEAWDVKSFVFNYQRKTISSFVPMFVENDSIFWIGSLGDGVIRFNYNTLAHQLYEFGNGRNKAVNDILAIHKNDSIMYLGTVSDLVKWKYRQESAKDAFILDREKGMLNDMVHGIEEDEQGFIWLSTNKGLVKYNPQNNAFHTYYYSNGLQIGEFSDDAFYTCPSTGNIFFGGINGLLYLPKKEVQKTQYYPQIFPRQLTLGLQTVPFDDYLDEMKHTLKLPGISCTFSLSFVAPDFIEGDNYEYSYRLKGFDDHWSPFQLIIRRPSQM